MKSLLLTVTKLMAMFLLLALVWRFIFDVSTESIATWYQSLKSIQPLYLILLTAVLLATDIIFMVPTFIIGVGAGHFLGFSCGFASVLLGLNLCGLIGYFLGQKYGTNVLRTLKISLKQYQETIRLIESLGSYFVIACRAVPMMPEVFSILYGHKGHSLKSFFILWNISSVPYAIMTTYAGSQSSATKMEPIYYAFCLYLLFVLIGYHFYKKLKRSQ